MDNYRFRSANWN